MNPNDPSHQPGSTEGGQTPPSEPYNPYSMPGQSPYPRPPMGENNLDLSVIGEAFEIITNNWKSVAIAGTIMFVPMLVIVGIAFAMFFALVFSVPAGSDPNPFVILGAQGILYLAVIVGYGLMGPGAIGAARIALQSRRGGPITSSLATSGLRQIGKGLGFAMVQYLGVMIGSFFCYLPGFLFGGLTMPGFAVLAQDENAGVGEAFTRSNEVMKPHLWMAALLYFILSVISGLGVIACFVGIIFTAPILVIGMTLAYLDVKHGKGMSDGVAPFPVE